MKKITIGNIPTIELKVFGGIYLSSFAGLWLLVEPLQLFGISPKLFTNFGWVGYLSLFIISLFIAICIGQVWRRIAFYHQDFIEVTVESSLEGIDYLVKAPSNTQLWDFSHLFIAHLEKGKASDKVKSMSQNYTPVLNLKRDGIKSELDKNITLKEAGLLQNDVLFITGKLIETDRSPRFLRTAE
jgi:hypothetical protein